MCQSVETVLCEGVIGRTRKPAKFSRRFHLALRVSTGSYVEHRWPRPPMFLKVGRRVWAFGRLGLQSVICSLSVDVWVFRFCCSAERLAQMFGEGKPVRLGAITLRPIFVSSSANFGFGQIRFRLIFWCCVFAQKKKRLRKKTNKEKTKKRESVTINTNHFV